LYSKSTGCPTSILPFSKAHSPKTKAARSKIPTAPVSVKLAFEKGRMEVGHPVYLSRVKAKQSYQYRVF